MGQYGQCGGHSGVGGSLTASVKVEQVPMNRKARTAMRTTRFSMSSSVKCGAAHYCHTFDGSRSGKLCYVRGSENGTEMALLTAYDNFLQRTLAIVPGSWGKLIYVSGLRQGDGDYEHWGLARVYGRNAASDALQRAHRDAVQHVLRTPLRELVHDARICAGAQRMDVATYFRQFVADPQALLPPKVGGGSARHLSSVLQAVAALGQVRKASSRQAS
jgi:hypothetical protein